LVEDDYKELVETPVEDAEECVKLAKEFLHYVKFFMGKNRI
jgi:HEPN domain-containing protein